MWKPQGYQMLFRGKLSQEKRNQIQAGYNQKEKVMNLSGDKVDWISARKLLTPSPLELRLNI